MEKRNKLWRKRHQWRLFKARMILRATFKWGAWDEDGNLIDDPHWFELAKQKGSYSIKLRALPVAVGCVGVNHTIAWITKRKLVVWLLKSWKSRKGKG